MAFIFLFMNSVEEKETGFQVFMLFLFLETHIFC